MSITKIANLKGQIDCPFCFSLLQWDDIKDIKVSNGNQYVVCPECGQTIMLKKGHDYWLTPDNSGQGQGGSSSQTTANSDIIVIEYSNNGTDYELSATKEELLSYIEEDKVVIAKYPIITGNTGSQGKDFNILILQSYYPAVLSNVLVDNFDFYNIIDSSFQIIFRAGPSETYPHGSQYRDNEETVL